MKEFNIKCSAIPPGYCYMWSEIVQSYCKLYGHYDKVITKQKHICKLAQPKHKGFKYRKELKRSTVASSKIQIVNKTDRTESTRTEQLAFPKLRHLTHLKSHPSFAAFNNARKSGVNRLIRKSLLSVYSRLQNVMPEEKPSQPKAWSKENNSKLMKRLKRLASPKKNYCEAEIPTISRNSGVGANMKRIRKLSKPRVCKNVEPNQWRLTKAMRNYKATEKVIKMSQPRKYEQHNEEDAYRGLQKALHYKATQRTKELATPAKRTGKIEERPENPFRTNSRALKAIASKRVIELASPKDYVEMHNRDDAYRVSRRALRAKTTSRLNELAEPKKR